MDKNFLLFLGNFLTNAAKGQEQLDVMVKWMQQGFKGSDELAALFRKSYGLDVLSESQTAYFKVWEKALVDFQKSFTDFLSLFGVVPLSQYRELLTKYESLKQKEAEQEEMIGHLREILGRRNIHQEELHQGYRELLAKQTDDFQKLVKGMADAMTGGLPNKETTPAKKRATSPSQKKERIGNPARKRTRTS